MKKNFAALLILLGFTAASNAFAGPNEWTYGIGTGLFGLNIKGSMGFKAPGGNFWPEVNGELNQGKTSDLMESAFGFGGYANKGDWTILYKVGQMKLGDTASGDSPNTGASVRADISFTGKQAEVDGVYAFAKTGDNYWGALGGLRYYNQRLTWNITTSPGLVPGLSGTNDVSASWVDAVVGITHKMPFKEKFVWHNQADIAGGGTKGTYHINTGVGWQFYKAWSADFYGNYIRYNYEKGTKGSSDNWYLYKAAEYGVGANVMYNW
jgi:hypothetical protein